MKKTPLFLLQALVLTGVFYYLGSQLRHFFSPVTINSEVPPSIVTTAHPHFSFSEAQKKYNEPLKTQQAKLKDMHEVSKIKLLQGMHISDGNNESQLENDKVNFYISILKSKNESWFVKRQAMKNMAPYWTYLDEQERSEILKNVDIRTRATWRETSSDLAHKIMGSYEP